MFGLRDHPLVKEGEKVAQKEAYASGEPQEAMRKFLEARKTKKN